MSVKTLRNQLLAAIAMVLVAALALGSSTFAWFSLNNTVTANGLEVKTKVSDNLLISGSNLATTTKNEDSTFGTTYTETLKAVLEPTSTVDGKNYFYTIDAAADGHKLNNTTQVPYKAYDASEDATDDTTYGNAFSEYYNITKTEAQTLSGDTSKNVAEGYIDYVFQLKAVATEANAKILLTGLNLFYNETQPTEVEKAFRVAVLVEDYNGTAFTATPGTLRQIYSESGAALFDGTAVNGVNSKAAITQPTGDNALVAKIATAGTHYYKVVVRLWLEGEDTTCYNAMFNGKNDKWTLDLEMKLVDSTSTESAVSAITKTYATNGG